jgi:hypothetical protein
LETLAAWNRRLRDANGSRWRISIGVHDALDLIIAGSASKELAFVIVIDVRATPR